MNLSDSYRYVLLPGNGAMSAIRRAGLCLDQPRIRRQVQEWEGELQDLERYVEDAALKAGIVLKYSPAHSTSPDKMRDFLYGAKGLGLPITKWTPTKLASTDDDVLMDYASLAIPRDDDHPIVRAILKIRSLSKAKATHLESYLRSVRADGAIHPKFNWALRTARIAAEDPPVHQIPERSDKDVADKVKGCFIPRIAPPPDPADWDPRIHGSCFRWDIDGAEAAIRAAMLTAIKCHAPDPVAYPYVREGKDLHSKTASLIYGVPDGTYKKGTMERDAVGKQTFFAKQYGARWTTVKATLRQKARLMISDQEAQRISDAWDRGYVGLVELYERDKYEVFTKGYVQDGYGRRRRTVPPPQVQFQGIEGGKVKWEIIARSEDDRNSIRGQLEHTFHVAANSPTQSMSAYDALWMLAYLTFGERDQLPLALPPMWEAQGLAFPEAAGWQFNEGPGPGGKPFRAWHSNAVHDSGWGDCAPGYLEPVAKTIWRRCRALPFDWRLKTDVPYRVSLSVGPNFAQMESYNAVAARFGYHPLPA